MEGLSERAYAAHSGLSRGAVQKARKTGRLVLFADGSINAVASDARRGVMTDPDQQLRSRGGIGAGDGAVSGPGDSTSYLKARTALTVYQAQERQLSIQKKKGVLVDRARTEALVLRLARQERDVWVSTKMRSSLSQKPRGATTPTGATRPGRMIRATIQCDTNALPQRSVLTRASGFSISSASVPEFR